MRSAACLAVLTLACGSRSGLSLSSSGGTSGSGGVTTGGSAGTGASGGAGGAGGCAFGSTPVALALGIPRAYDIAVDESAVFVTSAIDGGKLWRIPKSGGAPQALLSGLGRPRHVALDAERAWVTSPMDGRVLGVTKDGTAVLELVPPSVEDPEGIARSAGATFWVRQSPISGALLRWESAASGPSVLATGLVAPGALVVELGEAFWIDNDAGGTPGIWRFAPATAAAPEMLAPLPAANGNDLALDATHVYYAMNAEVGRVPRTGGAREPLASGTFATAVARDAGELYWVEGGATTNGRLARMPVAGGAQETLATGLVVPRGVALDEGCVYWTNQGVGDADGSVMVRAR